MRAAKERRTWYFSPFNQVNASLRSSGCVIFDIVPLIVGFNIVQSFPCVNGRNLGLTSCVVLHCVDGDAGSFNVEIQGDREKLTENDTSTTRLGHFEYTLRIQANAYALSILSMDEYDIPIISLTIDLRRSKIVIWTARRFAEEILTLERAP